MLAGFLEAIAPTPLADRFPRSFENEDAASRIQRRFRDRRDRRFRARFIVTQVTTTAATRIQSVLRGRLSRQRPRVAPVAPIMAHPTFVYPRMGGNARPDAWYATFYANNRNTNSDEGDFWCGGIQDADNNLVIPASPADILAYRPDDFKTKQRMDSELKAGLPEGLHLELPEDGKMKTPITTWCIELNQHLITRGMEGVFSVRTTVPNPGGAPRVEWHQLLSNFGSVTLAQVKASQTHLSANAFDTTDQAARDASRHCYDRFDKDNIRLSAAVIKASIGPNLLQRLSTVLDAGESANGPIIFKTILDQVMFMNATTVRTLSNKLGALTLKSIPGESVSKLSEQVTELAREIVGSGSPPSDLINLVSKPYTKGTVESFRNYALGIHMTVMQGAYTGTWQRLTTEHNAMYQDLVQSDEYPPAKGGKKDQDNVIQGLIAKAVDQKLSKLNLSNGGNSGTGKGKKKRECFNCGSTEHIAKDCPKKSDSNSNSTNKSSSKKDDDWRYKPPNKSKGESTEKEVDGKTYKWCGKCRDNKGLWTTGKYLHSTAEHRSKKKEDKEESSNNETARLAYIDEPLDFGFLAMYPSEWCSETKPNKKKGHPKGHCGNC